MRASQKILAASALAIVAAVVATVASLAVKEHRTFSASVFDADGCPPTVPGALLVLIDRTDPMSQHERERVIADVIARSERLKEHARLLLHVITAAAEDSANPAPLPNTQRGFRRCRPTSPADINPAFNNVRDWQRRYRNFDTSLRQALDVVTKPTTDKRTPLLEALEVAMWSPLFKPELARRELVIYGDLLQNSAAYSQRTGTLPSPCEFLASPLGRRLAARPWSGIDVSLEIQRNPRDALRQTPEHQAWWGELFLRLGAASATLSGKPVPAPTASCQTTTNSAPAPPKRSRKS